MPTSYRASNRGDQARSKTVSQSTNTNLSAGEARVGDILSKKGNAIFSIRPQDTIGHAVEVLRDKHIGAVVVVDATGALVGILSERDIVRKLADTPGRTLPHKVEDVMTKDVQTISPNETLVSALQIMTKGRFRHVPVTDDTGLIGMITIGDVVNHRLTALEHEALQLKQLIVG
ncbi:CBS domain-containing protein [Cognatishimia maritima]|uniref:CBS domain-containing protein n=1 Tax=Cognatishimia maritima TaxID=870908 RepID=A0A1M5T845_9RHOB|nr:CBS domain-containing protein [Cognatishimia maritima]SHH46876.1 CBS domain-containing protein [Cognatishimia maritima]